MGEVQEVVARATAQLSEWISSKTPVTVTFMTPLFGGRVSGELFQATDEHGKNLFRVAATLIAQIGFAPSSEILSEALREGSYRVELRTDKGYPEVEMNWLECSVLVEPLLDSKELLKALPVPPGKPN